MSRADKVAVIAWGFLMAATLLISWLSESVTLGATSAVALTLLIAAIKARVVVLHYMELKHAPLAWRMAFEGWVFGASAVILVGYLLSSAQ